MPTPVNRIPPGLLEYFGIKTGEWGPRELGQQLLPTLDLARWYLDSSAQQLQATIGGNPWGADTNATVADVTGTDPVDVTTGGVLRVPQTETWLILEAGVSWQSSASDNDAQFWWVSGNATTGFQAWPQRPMGYAGVPAPASFAAGFRQSAVSLTSPFWVPAGHTIGMQIGLVAIGVGGSVSISSAWLRLQRFRI